MTEKTNGSVRRPFLFARNFLKHPNMVGWMLPSSPFLVEQVLKRIDWGKAQLVVEYGPGVGTFTTEILKRMRHDATLIAFETNRDFFQFLRESLRDPRLRLIQGSAADVDVVLPQLGYGRADYVISGIPFKTLPHAARDTIVRKTHAVLHPKGAFLVYNFSTAVRPYLERVFGRVHQDFEWLNVLPARLFYCAP